MIDETVSQTSQTPVRYCQNCGRGLDEASSRIVGNAVYCEPCLEARLHGAPAGSFSSAAASSGSTGAGYVPVPTPEGGPAPAWQPAPAPSLPNPGLAALLGFIPGVGAMYNGQYAKGIVHLIVFTVLVSLTKPSDVFLIFVFGWEAYMVIEAHHTAKARRDGLPLPNPFNLNDIGERLGFGKGWPAGTDPTDVVRDAAAAARAGFSQHAGPSAQNPYQATSSAGQASSQPVNPAPPPTAWGVPPAPAAYTQPYPPGAYPYGNPYAEPARAAGQIPPAYTAVGNTPPSPFAPAPYPGTVLPLAASVNRFPAGAVWLIGLGAFFLLATTGVFHVFPAHALIGCVLIGLGVWSFLSRMAESGAGLLDDGSGLYPARLFRALRVAVWLVLAGVTFLLDASHLIRFQRSWPLFIILAGVMALVERASLQSSLAAGVPAAPAGPYPAQAPVFTPEPVAPATPNDVSMQHAAEPTGDR